MAGGQGTRLRPLTFSLPKPLLPVGERPIIEIILRQLRQRGFTRVFVSVGFKGHLIRAYLAEVKIDGLDIWPLLKGEADAKNPHDAYFFYYNTNELQAVRSGRWKLILPHTYRTLGNQPKARGGIPVKYRDVKAGLELYDLQTDEGEKHDVADGHPDVVKRLSALAEQAREDMGDALTGRVGKGAREPGRLVVK